MSVRRGARWLWLDHVRDRVRERTLSANAGHVAYVLVVHYINGRLEAWPTQQTLAAATGRSKRAVRRGLDELVQVGLLEAGRGHPGRTSGNVYRLVEVATLASSQERQGGTT